LFISSNILARIFQGIFRERNVQAYSISPGNENKTLIIYPAPAGSMFHGIYELEGISVTLVGLAGGKKGFDSTGAFQLSTVEPVSILNRRKPGP
jgi:hypothetical protein